MSFLDDLNKEIERISPSDYLTAALDPKRPYSGQPQTTDGERGRAVVSGLTFRDLKDCFIVGAFRSTGLPPEEYPKSICDIDLNSLDPIAWWQNMAVEIEKRMGIYPNVPPLRRQP